MDFQMYIDGMNSAWQAERAETQMTLGNLIEALTILGDKMIDRIEEPHSYRGYYCDLSFERGKGKMSAKEALELCQSAMGKKFVGYKGGDYVMGELTPVWIADYGCTGERIMDITEKGKFITEDDDG